MFDLKFDFLEMRIFYSIPRLISTRNFWSKSFAIILCLSVSNMVLETHGCPVCDQTHCAAAVPAVLFTDGYKLNFSVMKR
jgi:hypothetical protein